MAFSRQELTEIITPHVLRTVVRLQGAHGAFVSEAHVQETGLTEQQVTALVQTKRLLPEAGGYRIHL